MQRITQAFKSASKSASFSQKFFSSAEALEAVRQYVPATEIQNKPASPLTDLFGRRHSYLRISITEKCNLRCTYCMPEGGVDLSPSSKLLTVDEIFRIASVFAASGVNKIRLTGGEPTIRKDLVQIIGRLSQIPGIRQVTMTSNGIILHRNLEELVKAGLTGLNISLDTLDENKYMVMTRRNGFKKVLKSIEIAEKLFEYVKINNVVIRHVNDSEVVDFVALTEKRNLDVRFIEYMPFGGKKFEAKKMVPFRETLQAIEKKFPSVVKLEDGPNDTTKAYAVQSFRGKFGFITSMSEHFCGTCNRLRITADGNLKVCLHDNAELSLRDLMRSGADDSQLVSAIENAVKRKKKQHAGMENLMRLTNRPMILIGG